MKSFVQTIAVFAVLTLAVGSCALAEKPEVAVTDIAEVRAAEIRADASEVQELLTESLKPVGPTIDHYRQMVLTTAPSYDGAGRVLLIPADQVKPQQLALITEDLSVMSRILDKKLKDAHLGKDYDWFCASDFLDWHMPVTKSIYLEGYGALFLKRVNFPLSPPAEPDDRKQATEGLDPVWEQARREVYFGKEVFKPRRKKRSRDEYDAEKVEGLKRTLFEALRHTANIRNLEADEWVVITVVGESPGPWVPGSVLLHERADKNVVNKEIDESPYSLPSLSAENHFSAPAVVTMRVRKKDVDAFANFRKGRPGRRELSPKGTDFRVLSARTGDSWLPKVMWAMKTRVEPPGRSRTHLAAGREKKTKKFSKKVCHFRRFRVLSIRTGAS
jgi:hypothetical protein